MCKKTRPEKNVDGVGSEFGEEVVNRTEMKMSRWMMGIKESEKARTEEI